MSTNGINEAFNAGYKVKLENRGPQASGITYELKSIFDDMAKQGLIKDMDGKGLTKQDALNLYKVLNEMHEKTNRATNYTKMQAGTEFNYTAEEMKALAQAAGYEVLEQQAAAKVPAATEKTSVPNVDTNPPATAGRVGNGNDHEYDAKGNETRRILRNADGSVREYIDYEYDTNGNLTRVISRNPDGSVEDYNDKKYDANGNITRVIYRSLDGSVKGYNDYEYDSDGKMIRYTYYDADGNVIQGNN